MDERHSYVSGADALSETRLRWGSQWTQRLQQVCLGESRQGSGLSHQAGGPSGGKHRGTLRGDARVHQVDQDQREGQPSRDGHQSGRLDHHRRNDGEGVFERRGAKQRSLRVWGSDNVLPGQTGGERRDDASDGGGGRLLRRAGQGF